MTGPAIVDALPPGRLLRRAAEEADDMGVLLRDLEEAVGDVLSRGAVPAAARAVQLQSLDLLAQRLSGLSACLEVLAAALEEGREVGASRLCSVLPLGGQRAALLEGRPAPARHAGGSLELF